MALLLIDKQGLAFLAGTRPAVLALLLVLMGWPGLILGVLQWVTVVTAMNWKPLQDV